MSVYTNESRDCENLPKVLLQEGDLPHYIDIDNRRGWIRAEVLEDWTVAIVASIVSEDGIHNESVSAIMPVDEYRELCAKQITSETGGYALKIFLRKYIVPIEN